MITRIENEIVQLHQFFQDWYNNELSFTEENFSHCSNVLAPGFSIVFPSGEKIERESLLKGLWQAHNSRKGMRIWIKNVHLIHQIHDVILATYEEWQEIDKTVSARISSVAFQTNQNTPNGLLWLHVHETWITPDKS